MSFEKDEKGISNIVATILLIAIAVVGGAFAFMTLRDQAQTATTSAQVQVQDVTAKKVGGSVYASATAKNVGSMKLDNIDVVIAPGSADNITLDLKSAEPGVTVSDHKNGSDLSAGESYAVRITADTVAGGSITKTTTVRVES